ncbi:hypothetical protein Q8F55_000035 [Vanrija albida]|uniref:F-box domain-containing protein n=1 Tax=Vanrija albida TaxID=181172 RepID=A0ABR3QD44_9TREE
MIDHNAYPHIIECILGYSSLDTLVAFRSTSRRFRDQITAQLLSHAVLRRFPDRDNAYGFRLPPTSTLAPEYKLPFVPEYVRTLDLVAFAYAHCGQPVLDKPDSDLVDRFELHTLRRLGNTAQAPGSNCFPNVHTVVDYVDMSVLSGYEDPEIDLPLRAQRHIVHFTWDPSKNILNSMHVFGAVNQYPRQHTGHTREIPCRSDVREFVVVLWPAGQTTPADNLRGQARAVPLLSGPTPRAMDWSVIRMSPARRLRPLFELVYQLVPSLAAGATLTVVGVERCPPCHLSGVEGRGGAEGRIPLVDGRPSDAYMPSSKECFELFTNAVVAYWGGPSGWSWSDAQIDAALPNLRLVEYDQWFADLGDRAQIEGTWPHVYRSWCRRCWGTSTAKFCSNKALHQMEQAREQARDMEALQKVREMEAQRASAAAVRAVSPP